MSDGELANLIGRVTEDEVIQLEHELFAEYFFDGSPRDDWQKVKVYLEDRMRYEEMR